MVQPKIIGLQQSITIRLSNTAFNQIKLCLLPGYVDTTKMYLDNGKIIQSNSCPDNLNRLGYSCDQVAADYIDGAPGQFIVVSMDNGYSYDLFRRKVLVEDIEVKELILTADGRKDIKDITIDLAVIDEQRKAGHDYIKMNDYSLNHFTARFERPFMLKKSAFVAITLPASSKITLAMNYEIVTNIKEDLYAINEFYWNHYK